MRYFFQENGTNFYVEGVNSFIPQDAKEISEEVYKNFFNTIGKKGMVLEVRNGVPYAVPYVETDEDKRLENINNAYKTISDTNMVASYLNELDFQGKLESKHLTQFESTLKLRKEAFEFLISQGEIK